MIITRMFDIRVALSFFPGWQSSQIRSFRKIIKPNNERTDFMMLWVMLTSRSSAVSVCFMILDTCRRRFLVVWWRHWPGHWDRIWSDVVTPPLSSSISTGIDDEEETHTVPLIEVRWSIEYLHLLQAEVNWEKQTSRHNLSTARRRRRRWVFLDHLNVLIP